MNKDRNTVFHYIMKPLKNHLKILILLGLDRYVKKFTIGKFVSLIIYAQITQMTSIREIATKFNTSNDLKNTLQLDSISYSQISRKLKNIDGSHMEKLFLNTVRESSKYLKAGTVSKTIGRLHLIDSSTVTMCLSKYPWAEYRKNKSGVKLHLRLQFYNDIALPDAAIITQARPADRTQMDNLVIQDTNTLNVFDRAYVDYKKFDNYCDNQVLFATRLKSNAIVKVISEAKINKKSKIISDQTVILGKKTTYQMANELRLIKTKDSEENLILILTNDFNKSAEELAEIYRFRWKIELFFKWLKQHCHIKHFYGNSLNAVKNQIYIALISYCLLMLISLKEGYEGSLLTLQRIVISNFWDTYETFIKHLFIKKQKSSNGRKKRKDHLIFKMTMEQYEIGDIDHLNYTEIDPLF